MPDQNQTMPHPPVKGGLVTYLSIDGAVKAAAFYQKAFGAEIVNTYPVDDQGRTMHVHLYVNGSSLMLADFYPEHGFKIVAPQAYSLMLMVPDADAAFHRAVEAGAAVVMPPADMFWGDRYGQVKDAFGVIWAVNGPIKGDKA